MLRLRSDEQLVAQFRAGNDEAFRAIHDRYRRHLLAYVRQMLRHSRTDAEDVLQDAFLRASRGLRAHDQELSLRPWLYKIARNACIDELRRRVPAPSAEVEWAPESDPVAESEQRESLRRLVTDLGRLPEQQRSALLMRELGGMSYAEVAEALGISVPALKSLLVRARLGLVESLEARETACTDIRDELASAHARGMRPNALARRHLRDCACCRQYRIEIRRTERQLAALAPTLGVFGPLARLLGIGGGSGGAAAGGATGGGGIVVSIGALGASATHVATVVAAAVIAAAGAVGIREATTTTAPTHPSVPSSTATGTAALPTVPTAAAISLLSHLQSQSAQAAPSNPNTGAAPAATGSSSSATPSTPAAPPPATTTPTGGSSSTTSSCPIGEPSCGQPKSANQTDNRVTNTPTGSGSTTAPAVSGGDPTGSGADPGTGTRTSSTTPTGTSTSSSTPLGGTQTSPTSDPPAGTTTSSAPLGT